MGRYLDSLNEQFDEITKGVDEILDRATDEGRDPSKDELEIVNRDKGKLDELKKSIDHYSELEVTRSKVAELRGKVPAAGPRQQTTTVVVEREKEPNAELLEAFPTVGDYIVTVGRALRGDKDAAERIERATAHQTTADNPGIIPRPILEPVINLIDANRPFVQSVANKPLVTGAFDRPVITQHVAVGKQAGEKQPTDSQKLVIGKLPVSADTMAGHLNISRQDIKWSQPGIMQIVAEDFAAIYAIESDEDAVLKFLESLTDNAGVPVLDWDPATIRKVLFSAAATPLKLGKPLGFPDTFWMSVDVWATLGGQVSSIGTPIWPGLDPGNIGGTVAGFKAVVDPFFPPNTGVLGKGSLVEYFEDLDGFMQVAEPDVLGQLVGYAGFEDLLNTAPETFSVLTLPAAPPGALDLADQTREQAIAKRDAAFAALAEFGELLRGEPEAEKTSAKK